MQKRNPSVLIIGAGSTGMLAVIKLRQAGIRDITIIEKADKVGGTWRENTYPGVACDIPSHHYCYTFEPARWKHQCALGADIQEYMEHVGRKYNVSDVVKFGTEVTSTVYDDATGKWTVGTDKGDTYVVDFVIAATGILHHPKFPDIKGIGDFAGDMWHTAQWNHRVDLKGKRIGIIGTGSTSHQVAPELINDGHEVFVFQRTPQWVFPNPNIRFPEWLRERWRKKPSRLKFWKAAYQAFVQHFLIKATIGRPVQNWILRTACKTYLRLGVRNKELRKKLTPDYGVGCKRIVGNFTFYQAIQKDNAHLVTDGISQIEPGGVRLNTGELVELDVIVLSTGFYNFNYMRPMEMVGRAGHTIEDSWGDGRHYTYHAVLMEHFPNYILMLGPGTPIGNNSVIDMAEEQMKYVLQLIDIWRRGEADQIEPTGQAVEEFTDYLRKGLPNSVWTQGCQSWYLDADGIPVIFPYEWKEFLRSMHTVNTADLTMARLPAPVAEPKEVANAV